MPTTFTPPSWRADQPSSAEVSILGHPDQPAFLPLLGMYRNDRDQSAQDYHGYLQAINALQARNMELNATEEMGKLALGAVEAGGKYGGAVEAMQTNPFLRQATQGSWGTLGQNALQNALAERVSQYGAGVKGMSEGGVLIPQGTELDMGGLPMTATGIAAGPLSAALGGALRGSGGDQRTVTQTHVPGVEGPVQTQVQQKEGGGTAGSQGLGSALDSVTVRPRGAAPTRPDTPLPGRTAPQSSAELPTARNPTEGEKKQFDSIMSRVRTVDRSAFDDIVKGGNKFTVRDGKLVAVGASGQTYTLSERQRK